MSGTVRFFKIENDGISWIWDPILRIMILQNPILLEVVSWRVLFLSIILLVGREILIASKITGDGRIFI
jgi:hypothetical protein